METGDACDFVPFKDKHSDSDIRNILSNNKVVCVVGASDTPGKDAHDVPSYLMSKGYTIIPVNPNHQKVLGVDSYKSINDVTQKVDIVEIFRPSSEVYKIVQDSIKKHPKVIWMQEGIYDKKAVDIAEKDGITVIFNRCMYKEHVRLFGV
ncbi:MAG: CoA-binding protein [Candidatus Acidifodinimicrobium sp.]